MRDPVEAWKCAVRAKILGCSRAAKPGSNDAATMRLLAVSLLLPLVLAVVAFTRAGFAAALGVAALAAAPAARMLYESHLERRDARSGVDFAVARAEAALSNGAPDTAARIAREGLASALSGVRRRRLLRALAWAGIGRNDPFLAHGALLELAPKDLDVHLLASYLGACNRVDEAVELLEEDRRAGHRSAETTKLLADLLFRQGKRDEIGALAESDANILSPEDRRAVESAISGERA